MKSPLIEILSPFPLTEISINSENLPRCVELARRHGVEMLFYSRLKKQYAGSNPCVDEYLKQNERLYLIRVAGSMKQEALEKEIISTLGKQDIPACTIKGNEIARSIYDDPNCRSSADIDVLIRIADVIMADEILCKNGFTRHDLLSLPFQTGRLHHAAYLNEKSRFPVELHWDFGIPYFFDLTPAEIWKGVEKKDANVYSLTPEMMIILLFTHHFRHGFRQLKIITDILWSFYRYENTVNWREFADRLGKYGMIKTAVIILNQMEDLWGLSNGQLKSFKILEDRFKSAPVRPPKYLLRYFKMDIEKEYKTDNTPDMQMAKLALDKKSKIIYSFAKIFFPMPREIRAFYPDTAVWMLPFNYLRFICWRVTKWNVFS